MTTLELINNTLIEGVGYILNLIGLTVDFNLDLFHRMFIVSPFLEGEIIPANFLTYQAYELLGLDERWNYLIPFGPRENFEYFLISGFTLVKLFLMLYTIIIFIMLVLYVLLMIALFLAYLWEKCRNRSSKEQSQGQGQGALSSEISLEEKMAVHKAVNEDLVLSEEELEYKLHTAYKDKDIFSVRLEDSLDNTSELSTNLPEVSSSLVDVFPLIAGVGVILYLTGVIFYGN